MKIGFNQPQAIQTTQAKDAPKFKGTVLQENDEYRVVMQRKHPKNDTIRKITNIAKAIGVTSALFLGITLIEGKMNGISISKTRKALPKIFEALNMEKPKGLFKFHKGLKAATEEVLNKAVEKGLLQEAQHINDFKKFVGYTKNSAAETGKFAVVWECIAAVVRNIAD